MSVIDAMKYKSVTNCRSFGFSKNLSFADPASKYQTQKIIQNTVRVPTSLYTSDLAALTVYQTPGLYGVNWNNISDRRERHVQPTIVSGGSFYHASSTKSTITRCRPNAGCPGGAGVDMKHGSYDRYLRRLVGKGPARRGVIPPDYGQPFVFDPSFPVYGDKTIKTSIVGTNCNCPIDSTVGISSGLYTVLLGPSFFNDSLIFVVGNNVYALNSEGYYSHAVVQSIDAETGIYTIIFDDGTILTTTNAELLIYFPCKCNDKIQTISNIISSFGDPSEQTACYVLNEFYGANSELNTINYIKTLLPPSLQKFLCYYYNIGCLH